MEVKSANLGLIQQDPDVQVPENGGEGRLGVRSVKLNNPKNQNQVSESLEQSRNPEEYIQQAGTDLMQNRPAPDGAPRLNLNANALRINEQLEDLSGNRELTVEDLDDYFSVNDDDASVDSDSLLPQPAKIADLRSDMIQIAANVFGNGSFEGRSGGEGHIGLIGDEVVKFNTHSGEYEDDKIERLKTENPALYGAMVNSSKRLCQKFVDILENAILLNQEHIPARFRLGVRSQLALVRSLAASDELLTRRDASRCLSIIFDVFKLAGMPDVEQLVWQEAEQAAPKHSTKKIADTRSFFEFKLTSSRMAQEFLLGRTQGGVPLFKAAIAAGKAKLAQLVNDDPLPRPEACNAGDFRLTDGTCIDGDEFVSVLRLRRFMRLLESTKAMLGEFSDACKTTADKNEFNAMYAQLDRLARAVGESTVKTVCVIRGEGGDDEKEMPFHDGLSSENYRTAIASLRSCLASFADGSAAVGGAHNRILGMPVLAARRFSAKLGEFVLRENRHNFEGMPIEQASGAREKVTLEMEWRKSQLVTFDEFENSVARIGVGSAIAVPENYEWSRFLKFALSSGDNGDVTLATQDPAGDREALCNALEALFATTDGQAGASAFREKLLGVGGRIDGDASKPYKPLSNREIREVMADFHEAVGVTNLDNGGPRDIETDAEIEELLFCAEALTGGNHASRLDDLLHGLVSVASIAYGDHHGEKTAGGKGDIGLVGDTVVKFNTHSYEYDAPETTDEETANAMQESSLRLLDKLSGMVKSAVIVVRANSDGHRLSYVQRNRMQELLATLSDMKERRFRLKRADAAPIVTQICEFLAQTGGFENILQEVWNAAERLAPSLSTKNVRDTRAAFMEKVRALG